MFSGYYFKKLTITGHDSEIETGIVVFNVENIWIASTNIY